MPLRTRRRLGYNQLQRLQIQTLLALRRAPEDLQNDSNQLSRLFRPWQRPLLNQLGSRLPPDTGGRDSVTTIVRLQRRVQEKLIELLDSEFITSIEEIQATRSAKRRRKTGENSDEADAQERNRHQHFQKGHPGRLRLPARAGEDLPDPRHADGRSLSANQAAMPLLSADRGRLDLARLAERRVPTTSREWFALYDPQHFSVIPV